MSDFKLADFDKFRFLRDDAGNIAAFEGQFVGEELFPVLDCEFYRLARLHMHSKAATRHDVLESFEKEMGQLAAIDSRVIAKPSSKGQDDEELYYVNPYLDGEILADYITREGARDLGTIAHWLIPIIKLIESLDEEDMPLSLARLTDRNCQVVRDLESNEIELRLTEFSAWTKPGEMTVERGPMYYVAQLLVMMVAGPPLRSYTEDFLPSAYYDLETDFRDTIEKALHSKPGEHTGEFFDYLKQFAEEHPSIPYSPFPRAQLPTWISTEFAKQGNLQGYPELTGETEIDPEGSLSIQADFDGGLPCSIQYFPGTQTLAQNRWFPQHWESISRKGRNSANQLEVYEVEEGDSVSLIIEEEPRGLHLRRLIREIGPLDLDSAVSMVDRLSSALDGLEATANSSPVWWLPAQNIYVNLDTRESVDYLRAIDHEGPEFWERIPYRLRLHQTFFGLIEGVDLPHKVLALAAESARESPHIRRTSVLLPIVTRLLTGAPFQWEQEIEVDSEYLPEGLGEFLNITREQLNEEPLSLEVGFLNRLKGFIEVWDHQTYHEEAGDYVESPEGDVEGGESVVNGQTARSGDTEEIQTILDGRLGSEKIEIEEEEVDFVIEQEIDERVRRREEMRRRFAQKEAERKQQARELLGLDGKKNRGASNRSSLLGWLYVIVAALVLGIGFGYYLHTNVNREGHADRKSQFEFPLTQYDVITPRVNPFTDLAPITFEKVAPPTIEVPLDTNDLATAITRSKNSITDKKFAEAVNYALWGVQLSPESAVAAENLEFALKSWIESGIDSPDRTNDPSSASVLAEYYIKGSRNKTAEGLYILMASALRGDTKAMRIFGLLFGQGRMVPKSPAIALKWLKMAAEKGDHHACFYFGESSVFGTMIPRNTEGFVLLEKAADAGHPRSLLFRGYCQIEGLAIAKDDSKGFIDVAKASNKGSLDALFQMGLCRARGIGTQKSEQAAASAFKDAASLGYVPAMYMHGMCLINGVGFEESYAEGVAWVKKAALAGYFDARNWCSQNGVDYQGEAPAG